MTEEQAVELVSDRFRNQWPTESSATPFVLENDELPLALSTFAQMTIKHTRGGPRTAGEPGKRRKRVGGWIFVKIWGPASAGRQGTSQLADAARRVFEGQSLALSQDEPVSIYVGETQEIGVDGRHYMTSVQFQFDYWARF